MWPCVSALRVIMQCLRWTRLGHLISFWPDADLSLPCNYQFSAVDHNVAAVQ